MAESPIFLLGFVLGPVSAQPKPEADLSGKVKEILRTNCLECHGGAKTLAKLKILDHAYLVKGELIVAGKPEDSEIVKRIALPENDGSRMPESPRAPLAAADIETIRAWIVAGAKPFPPDVVVPQETKKEDSFKNVQGIDYVHKQILTHLRGLEAKDRQFIRYFSINHLVTSGATREQLDLYRDALAKAINHLSWESEIAPLIPVDAPTSSIFAIDLRKVGWTKKPLKIWSDNRAQGVADFNLWDLVLLEYPYGVLYQDSETYANLYEEYLRPAGLVRPIPFLRVDWFVSTATQSPLYEDLLGLPRTVPELETLLGVNSAKNLAEGKAFRAAMTVSGVSRNNRAVERHPALYGAYWVSIDYKTSKGSENFFADPINLRGAGGEFIFHLPNKLQGYYIATSQGKRLEFAPTDIVTDKFASDKVVRNGLACMRCHDKGMQSFIDTMRPALEKLPGNPGFDKKFALDLYPPQSEWEKHLKQDGDKFQAAMQVVLGKPHKLEPLAPTSHRYLDLPIGLTDVAGELGLTDRTEIKAVFRLPQFAGLGLISLANEGQVRRDTWEDEYGNAVRALGLGIPVVPLDAVTRPDILPTQRALQVEVRTNRRGNAFAPGDEAVIFVTNKSKQDTLFLEMIGTDAEGKSVVLVSAGQKLNAGETYRFPQEGRSIKVRGGAGKERITVFAGTKPFPGGLLLRGDNLGDRFVHQTEEIKLLDGRMTIVEGGTTIVKKTLELDTK